MLDLKGSPLEMKMPVLAAPKQPEPDMSLDSFAEAAAAPEPLMGGGLDLGAL